MALEAIASPNRFSCWPAARGRSKTSASTARGAFWEDRYHATAIEGGEHLLHCVVYIDLNMVRAGVVLHPREWAHGGYREIHAPRRRYVLIDYKALGRLAGFDDFARFQEAHRHWVEAALAEQGNGREASWTESVAVGREDFVRRIGQALGGMARGRSIRKADAGWELREAEANYTAHLGGQNPVIGGQNRRFWRLKKIISVI